jgi:hypothetical protein
MKPIENLRYSDGQLIKIGDTVSVSYGQQYVGGGSFHYKFNGTVLGEDCYAGLVVKVGEWLTHQDCSQRLGSSAPRDSVTVSSRYDYQKRHYVLDGAVKPILVTSSTDAPLLPSESPKKASGPSL